MDSLPVEGESVTRALKCDKCGERLDVFYISRRDKGGRLFFECDKADLERHYTAHAYRALEARYGPNESAWPSHVDSMRRMQATADARAADATAKRERGRVEGA